MEGRYRILIVFFAVIALVCLAGFYRTYFSYFPDVARFPALIHIHFVAFLGWFVLVVLQPILIYKEQYVLHRKLGKLSYFLAPILILTILLLTREKMMREVADPEANASITAFIGLMDAVSFSVCYLIAMIKRSDTRWHVAFIIGATLIALNPGLARLFDQITVGLGLLAAVLTPFIVSISIFIFEKISYKRPITQSPYFVFFLLWTLEIVLFITVPQTELW
ncbi:MAG: hypothetical protein KF685_08275, partial [Acidobacteria bacterium]|nr:hypothetical protein [Acidobacteriota bacterium]